MEDAVYKTIEITGASSESTDHAVELAIQKASETIRKIRWFEVVETRGAVADGGVAQWQVTVKIGFHLSDEE